MSEVLAGPWMVAALVLCVAAVAKVRAPDAAVGALGALGVRTRSWQVRALALVELALGVGALVAAPPWPAVALAALYGAFALLGIALQRRDAACGCFGAAEAPVSAAQWLLSAALAVVCAAAAAWRAHGVGWMLSRPVLGVGVAGCVYAVVLVYTWLPMAWGAWRPE